MENDIFASKASRHASIRRVQPASFIFGAVAHGFEPFLVDLLRPNTPRDVKKVIFWGFIRQKRSLTEGHFVVGLQLQEI